MKKIAAIGLLVLLLYNTFGLSLAVFFFEKDFEIASPASNSDDLKVLKMYLPSLPYSESMEKNDGSEGLVRSEGNFYNITHLLHQNDTLVVTLKSNQVARDRFFELVSLMETITDKSAELPGNSQNKALKILDNLVKNYLPMGETFRFTHPKIENVITHAHQQYKKAIYNLHRVHLNTPPPERA